MSELTVVIKGLAFCSPKTSEAQVLFPHAPGHDLIVTRSIQNGPDEFTKTFAGENTLKAVLENGAASINPANPKNDLINIAQWHNEAKSSLKFMTRNSDPASMPISFLSLPVRRIFSGSAVSELHYEIWAHRTGGDNPLRDFVGPRDSSQKPDKFRLAEEAVVKFDIPEPDPATPAEIPAVKFLINNDPQLTITFTHRPDTNFTLTLDNHCKTVPCVPDFGYYYEMLESTDKEGNNVEINEIAVRRAFELPHSPDSLAACNPVLGYTKCDLNNWRNGGPGCKVMETP